MDSTIKLLYKIYADGNLRAETFNFKVAEKVANDYKRKGYKTHITTI